MKKTEQHVGSSLDDFLAQEEILDETRSIAVKEARTWQLQQAKLKNKLK